MKSKLKIFSVLALFLVGLIAVSGIANADSVTSTVQPVLTNLPVSITKLYVNGDPVEMICPPGTISGGECNLEDRADINRGNTIEVKVRVTAANETKNVVVEASIRGLTHDQEKARAETDPFNVKAGKSYYETLTIELPERMTDGDYVLRIAVYDDNDNEVRYNLPLTISADKNKVIIKDVVFDPSGDVKAGRALLTTVRLKNMGEDTEDDVKVTVSIPELGISASDYIDEVKAKGSVKSEELYMRVPECAKAGDYRVTVTVKYDDGKKKVSKDYTVTVIEGEACDESPPTEEETEEEVAGAPQKETNTLEFIEKIIKQIKKV